MANRYTLILFGLLTACSYTDNQAFNNHLDEFNAKVERDLPAACAMISSANSSFVAVASTGVIDAKIIIAERVAFVSTEVICADPSQTVANMKTVTTLKNAYLVMLRAKLGILDSVALQSLVR